jgi:poly(hydroxyalkanoate) granule-associated protein
MVAKRKSKSRRTSPRAASSKTGIVHAGHQIWLAGLGALARAQSEGPKLFESLVEEGSAVHERKRESTQRFVKETWEGLRENLETRAEGVREKASETLENLEEIFQTRVKKALQQLGMPSSEEIQALSRKVNELNRSVQTLTRGDGRARSASKSDKTSADKSAAV